MGSVPLTKLSLGRMVASGARAVTGIEALILKKLGTASGGLLSALVTQLVKQSDKRLRGTKLERRLGEVVLSAIVSAFDASADEPFGELRDHTLQLLTESPASAGTAAAIVLPPGVDGDDVQASWVAGIRQQLIAGGADLETLPIDVDRFIATLPHALWRDLQAAGNEPDSPLAHLVTHLQNARTEALVRGTPEATVRLTRARAERRRKSSREKALGSFRHAVRAAGDELPYLAIRSRLYTEGRGLSDLYMTQRLVEWSRNQEDAGVQRSGVQGGQEARGHPRRGPRLPRVQHPPLSRQAADQAEQSGRQTDPGTASDTLTSLELPVEQVVRAHDHVLVVAASGEGKSTMVHHICATLDSDSNFVPIPVTARGLAGHREGWSRRLKEVVAEELRHTVPGDLFGGPPTADTKWLLLVDGLDEVGFLGARTKLIDDLLRLARESSSQFKVMVTSRPLDDLRRLKSAGFRAFDLRPVPDDEPQRFARVWFSAGPSSDPERGDILLSWLDQRGVPYRTSPLLLTMAALLFERDVAGALETRVDVYDAFIDTLLNKNEEGDDAFPSFELPWSQRLPERGRGIAARLWEERLPLLEHLADWRQQGNDGELVSEAVTLLRKWELVPAGLPGWWLTERIAGLLVQTGLVAGRGNLDFVHETLREYLAASMLARQVGPNGPTVAGMLDGKQRPGAIDVLSFAVAIWAARGSDVEHLLERALEADDGILVAASALADQVRITRRLAQRIASEMVAWPLRQVPALTFFRVSLELKLLLERAVAQPEVHAAVMKAAGDRTTPPQERAELIRLLRAPGDRGQLYGMLTDDTEPRTVRIAAANALHAGGEPAGIVVDAAVGLVESPPTPRS